MTPRGPYASQLKRPKPPGFPSKLRSLRVRKGLTQGQLGSLTGVSKAHVCALETGKAAPSLKVLLALAEALGVRPGKLLPR